MAGNDRLSMQISRVSQANLDTIMRELDCNKTQAVEKSLNLLAEILKHADGRTIRIITKDDQVVRILLL